MLLVLGAGRAGAQVDDPVVIDLASLYDGQRLGIDVTIGSGLTEQYLFDTGSPWFTTAWATNAPWWPDASDASTDSTNFIYGPGSGENKFSAYPATNDSVSIIGTSGSFVTDPIIYGEYAHYTNDPKNNIAEWKVDNSFPAAISKAVHSNTPPIQEFFGILGADLIDYNDGLLNIVENQSYGTNLVKGFVVSGGPINPTLTIAPERNTLTNFTTTYPMNTNPNGSIQQALISPSYRISWNGVSTNVTSPTLLDSGTPPKAGIVITQGSNLNLSSFTYNALAGATYLDPGVSITALIGNTPYTLTSQNNDPIQVYGSPTNTSAGGILYGLNFFENYNVLYNLQNKTVGIEAVPTTYVWVEGRKDPGT